MQLIISTLKHTSHLTSPYSFSYDYFKIIYRVKLKLMKKLIVFSVVFFSGLFILLAGPPSVSAQCTYPNGCYDCQWRDVAGRYACRAVNVRCASGYTHDSDRCGQLTPQGEDVCEDPANQNLSCVLPSGA